MCDPPHGTAVAACRLICGSLNVCFFAEVELGLVAGVAAGPSPPRGEAHRVARVDLAARLHAEHAGPVAIRVAVDSEGPEVARPGERSGHGPRLFRHAVGDLLLLSLSMIRDRLGGQPCPVRVASLAHKRTKDDRVP